MDDALALMRRDIAQAPLLGVLVLLPVLLGVYAGSRGSRLGLVPLVVFVAQMAGWFAYYATDWFSNPGLGVALMGTIGPALVGLLFAVTAVTHSHRLRERRQAPALTR